MKVRVTLTVDVDPDGWALQYGTSTDAPTVRADVREYILSAVQMAEAPITSAALT